MNGKKSKFDAGAFYNENGWSTFCANRARYTREQSIELFKQEMGYTPTKIEEASVSFGFGVNADGEKWNGWWVQPKPDGKRLCPVWCME